MPVKQWVQYQFLNAGRYAYTDDGDFWDSAGLVASQEFSCVRPLPAFSVKSYPTGFKKPANVSFYIGESFFLFDGRNASNQPVSMALTSDFSLDSIGLNIPLTLSTLSDSIHWGGELWRIFSGTVYKSTTSFDSGHKLKRVRAYGNRLFFFSDYAVYKLNRACTALEKYIDLTSNSFPLQLSFVAPYRQYILIVHQRADGTLTFNRMADNSGVGLHEIVSSNIGTIEFPGAFAYRPDPFCIHQGDVYFILPTETTSSQTVYTLYLYKDNAIKAIAAITHDPLPYDRSAVFLRLLSWNNHLVLLLENDVYVLAGRTFTTWTSFRIDEDWYAYQSLYVAGTELVFTYQDTDGLEAFSHTNGQFTTGGSLTTSWLDMGQPGTKKFLHNITAVLDAAYSGQTTTIQYRTDFSDTWITAVSAASGTNHRADALKVEFYTIQIKLTLNNTAATAPGIRALSCLYSHPN